MLRALGPGSVSSVLKIGLDVVHVLLWIACATLGFSFLAIVLAQPFLSGGAFTEGLAAGLSDPNDAGDFNINGRPLTAAQASALIRGASVPIAVAALTVYVGSFAWIVGRLRRVFATLTRGDPFHPDNALRLRAIGFALALVELLNQVAPDIVYMLLPPGLSDREPGLSFDLTTWFAVAVVFVLAEVFREGARLRREAELTI